MLNNFSGEKSSRKFGENADGCKFLFVKRLLNPNFRSFSFELNIGN